MSDVCLSAPILISELHCNHSSGLVYFISYASGLEHLHPLLLCINLPHLCRREFGILKTTKTCVTSFVLNVETSELNDFY